jgi:hypothetical protein
MFVIQMLKTPLIILFFYFATGLMSQTGPGGVGSSANNVFWVKADKGTSSTVSNTPISAWNDQSGNSVNMSQTVAAQQPSIITNFINGYPSIRFDNVYTTNDKMMGPDSPVLDNTNGYSFFTVTTPQNLDGEARTIVSKRTWMGIDQSFMLFYYWANRLWVDIQQNDNRFYSNSSYTSGNSYIMNVIYDGTLPDATRSRIFNDETLDITATESASLIPNNASPIVLGSTDANDSRPFGGYISEVIIYRTALLPAQRTIVNNYLSAKYNIVLSANDRYAGDNNGNGDYDREVAGIGKESTGSNDSFSTYISGGLGITAVSGFDNSDYVLAGHAVAVNTLETSDVGGMSGTNKARWSRIWYIDVTNISTQITANISFGATDAGMGSAPLGTTLSDYVLLYRAGLSGNWTELATASNLTGDRATFNNVTLSSDGYYTLGSKNYTTSILPIELTSFEAKSDEDKVNLQWTTASEKNNQSFTIEKTADGENFEIVAVIPGAGNVNSQRSYSHTDNKPYQGLSYYRLKQSDFSGDITYSKLVAVYSDKEIEDLLIYPNPSEDNFTISSAVFDERPVIVKLIDATGKTVFNKTLLANGQKLSISIENSPQAGNYMLLITNENRTFVRKIVMK